MLSKHTTTPATPLQHKHTPPRTHTRSHRCLDEHTRAPRPTRYWAIPWSRAGALQTHKHSRKRGHRHETTRTLSHSACALCACVVCLDLHHQAPNRHEKTPVCLCAYVSVCECRPCADCLCMSLRVCEYVREPRLPKKECVRAKNKASYPSSRQKGVS